MNEFSTIRDKLDVSNVEQVVRNTALEFNEVLDLLQEIYGRFTFPGELVLQCKMRAVLKKYNRYGR